MSAATLRAQTVPLVGNHPRLESSQIEGPLDSQKELTLEINFALRNPSALSKLQAEQQQPGSPNYRHWLTPDEFNAQFGPSPEDFKAVADWLSQRGFTIVESNPAARYIRVSGPVSLVESTFAVHQLSMGDSVFANDRDPQIPARFQNIIASIQGLDNMRAAMALKKKLAASRPITSTRRARDNLKLALLKDSGAAQSEGVAEPETNHGGVLAFAPNDVYTFYDVNPLLNSGITGTGCIAVVGDSNFLGSAVALFNSTFGVPTESVNVVLSSNKNGKFTNPGITSDEPESLLDIEWSHAAAPGTSVNFYLGDNNNTVNGSIFDAIRRAVSDNTCSVIAVSFGLCGYENSFYTGTYDPIAAQAASQGQSILIASDDVGAAAFVVNSSQSACVAGTTRGVNELSADPNVTSVGGSSFNPSYDQSGNDTSTVSDNVTERVVWETSSERPPPANTGASGGGASGAFVHKPAFQQGVTPNDGLRDVPDVALLADPGAPGAFIGDDLNQSGSPSIGCCYGGTSLSAQVFAGLIKLVEQKAGQRLGNIDTILYQLASNNGSRNGVRDITGGINTFNDVAGFPAVAGYDQSTGWGEVDATEFANAFALGGSITVTSTGSSSASAGQTNVALGTFTIMNTTGGTETISSVTASVSHTTIFASMTLTCTSPGSTSASVTPPTSSSSFDFSSGIAIPAGGSATFALTGTIAMNPAMVDRDAAYAAVIGPIDTGNGFGTLAMSLSLLGFGLMLMPVRGRRRAWLALIMIIALASTQVGCGGGGGGSSSSSSSIASTQAVSAIAATNDSGAVLFEGLPARLGTIKVR